MWLIKNLLALLSVLFYCLPLSVCSASPATYLITGEQLIALEEHLNELANNNERLKNLLMLSGMKSDEVLNELTKSKQELTELRKQLNAALTESEKARLSLETANTELRRANESLKKSEAQKARIKEQRTIWQIIAAGLLAWGVNK